MDLSFIQTSDPFKYSKMLDQTSRTVKVYAERHGARYESFVGLKKGMKPWQASFNRIFMIEDLLERGATGWLIYLDADAWIADLEFDLRSFLFGKDDFIGIFASSGASTEWWDVNDGVFLLNLSHPSARSLIHKWKAQMDAHWAIIAESPTFPPGGPDDQSMLHDILRTDFNPSDFGSVSREIINSQHAQFIRQHLRADQRDLDARTRYIRDRVEEVLGEDSKLGDDIQDVHAWELTDALYRGILRREPDGGANNGYYQLISKRGAHEGIQTASQSMIDSPEFSQLILKIRS